MDKDKAKYIAYIGGIGSGKTLIGCVTVLGWAVMYPGTYLICRQFYPELKDTTMRTFFEICPQELIVDRKVAESSVTIRAVGGTSTILFRPLEEPDKLRSLNLSGFYIDEGAQVSEEAFLLLQGRLRHQKGLRKGIITSNSGGHDYLFRWFFKKDHITSQAVKDMFHLIKAPSTENKHLPDGYVQMMYDTWTPERIEREINASFDAYEGAIFPEFRRDINVVKPFKIPANWVKSVGADHGFRSPASWIWGAVDEDANLYIYREFYEKEWIIEEICKTGAKGRLSAYHRMQKGEEIQAVHIDPSTKARRGEHGKSDFDIYRSHLPDHIALIPAKNGVTASIDLLRWYFKPDLLKGKPKIFIFDTCPNLIEEIVNYRYQELSAGSAGKKTAKEAPVKVDDHAVDALRYLVMSLPDPRKPMEDPYKKIKYQSLEGRLYRDLQEAKGKTKKKKDPFIGGL